MLRPEAGGSATSLEAQVRTWREQALTVVLRAALLIGGVAGAGMAYRAYGDGSLWQIPVLVGAYAMLAADALCQRLPFSGRVWILLSVLHGAGTGVLVLTEIPGLGLCVLLAVLYLTALFVGPRGAAASAGLTVGMLFLLAGLAALGRPILVHRTALGAAEWMTLGVAYAGLSLVVSLPARDLQRRFIHGLQEARQRSAGHVSERDELQLELAERTMRLELWAQYLEAITELTHSATAILDDPQALLKRVVELISERLAFYHTAVFLVDRDRSWLELQAASSGEGRHMVAEGYRLPLGGGDIVGRVAIDGVAQVTRRVGEGALGSEAARLPRTRSEVALPLRVQGETIGVLDVHSTEPGVFSDDDVGVLQILADQIAIALSNARLSRQVGESAEAMRQAYGEMGLEAWRSLLHSRGELSVRHDPSGALADGALAGVAYTAPCEGKLVVSEGTQGAVAVPVQVRGGHQIGVVHAIKPREAGAWNSEELELLRALVDQLGVALDGAQLYQESQERAERERLVAGIAARMRESLDVDTVLRTAVREIGELMGFAEVEVRMRSRNGNRP